MNQLLFEYEECIDRTLVGGKAHRVAELWKAGFRVPEGFVVPTIVSKQAIEESSLPKADPKPRANSATPYLAPRLKRRRFLNAAVFESLEKVLDSRLILLTSDAFVVRSSSIVEDSEHHTFAGEFESYLYVTRREVLSTVKRCLLSPLNGRAISYARQSGLVLPFEIAALIQTMVFGDFSGVVFTESPTEPDYMVIELVHGLADKLVQGQAAPFRYHFHRSSGRLRRDGAGTVEVDRKMLGRLYDTAMKVEGLFGRPQDIELTITGGEVILLQARDIPIRRSFSEPLNLDLR